MRKRFIATYLLMLMLSACQAQNQNYSYLMRHPEYLQQAYNQCIDGKKPLLSCEVIIHAQKDFDTLVKQRQQDPEAFGAQIMQAQEESAYLKAKWLASKQTTTEYENAEAAYHQSSEKVKILHAVIAATSMV